MHIKGYCYHYWKISFWNCCLLLLFSPKFCPIIWDPMKQSMPGSLGSHCFVEFAQIHAHGVGDTTGLPSLSLGSPSPFAFSPSQHQGLYQKSALCISWPKYWGFSFSISPSTEYSGLISFRIDWFDILVVHAKMGTIKDRNGMHITEAENTKKRCSRMHRRTVQKSLNDPDNVMVWSLT